MLYLKLFEELVNPKLDDIYKKVSKNDYLSKSTIDKLKEIGVSLDDFEKLKEKISKAYELTKIINDNSLLLEELFVELDDMLDEASFDVGRINTNLVMDFGRVFFGSGMEDPKNILINLNKDTSIIETTFSAIDRIIDYKETLYRTNRETQLNNSNYKRQGNRDYGDLSKWRISNIFYKNKINLEISFFITFTKFIDDDVRYRVRDKVKEIYEKLFELNDIHTNISINSFNGPYRLYITL